jgi:hypothetical protein
VARDPSPDSEFTHFVPTSGPGNEATRERVRASLASVGP